MHTEETKLKISKSMTGRVSPKKGIRISALQCFCRNKNCGNLFVKIKSLNKKFCSSDCRIKYYNNIRTDFENYKIECAFKFSVNDYPLLFDLQLIEKYGWYSPTNKKNNLLGISRDHMYSIKDGFENGIDPKLICHPANCKLMQHKENQLKKTKSSITIEELLKRICACDPKG